MTPEMMEMIKEMAPEIIKMGAQLGLFLGGIAGIFGYMVYKVMSLIDV